MILQKHVRPNINKLDDIGVFNDEEKRLLKQYLVVEKDYRYALREMSAKLENLDDYCELMLLHNPIHHMESRIKTPNNIIEKIHRRGYSLDMPSLYEYIYDIAGIRVICNYISDIYRIIDLLKGQRDLTIRIQKDYIKNPKPSGYRSVHIVFDMEMYIDCEIKTVPVEIQFRTIAMDMWASLEHDLRYKTKEKISEEDSKSLRQYSDDLYNVDVNMERIYSSKKKEVTNV